MTCTKVRHRWVETAECRKRRMESSPNMLIIYYGVEGTDIYMERRGGDAEGKVGVTVGGEVGAERALYNLY